MYIFEEKAKKKMAANMKINDKVGQGIYCNILLKVQGS
jgi:hypothetical protein